MKTLFITNFCPHYRVRTFELLAARLPVEFLFFSGGEEWYWPARFGVRRGAFPHRYLPGLSLGGTRITPQLVRRLLFDDFDAIVKCINGRFALPVTYLLARLRRKPFVLWTGVWQRLGTPFHRFLHPVVRHIYRHSDAIVVYGEHVRRFLIDSEGVDPQRVFVAPHATDDAPYAREVQPADVAALRRDLDLPLEVPVVLFAGRLDSAKGIDVLVEALAGLAASRWHLLIVGDGPERQRLRVLIEERQLDGRVSWVSGITPADMYRYYALADMLVLPSTTTALFREPWGLVVNEAFYQGIPAVVTESVGAAAGGLVENGVTGLVVPERDEAALGSALHRLLDDPALRRRLGHNARVRIHGWTNERMVDGFEEAITFARRRKSS